MSERSDIIDFLDEDHVASLKNGCALEKLNEASIAWTNKINTR